MNLDLKSINLTSNGKLSVSTAKYSCAAKDNCSRAGTIDYTFKSHKKCASENYVPGILSTRHSECKKIKDKLISEKLPELHDYMDDLIKTWILNFDIITDVLKLNSDIVKGNNDLPKSKVLFSLCELIKKHHNKKLELVKSSAALRGKLLIEMLVQQEKVRGFNEANFKIKKMSGELEEKSTLKDSVIIRKEKRFDEVDEYIEKQCRKSGKFLKYRHFKIIPFVRENLQFSYYNLQLKQGNNLKQKDIAIYHDENFKLYSASSHKQGQVQLVSLVVSESKISELNKVQGHESLEFIIKSSMNKVLLIESLINKKLMLKNSLLEKQHFIKASNLRIQNLINDRRASSKSLLVHEQDFEELIKLKRSILNTQNNYLEVPKFERNRRSSINLQNFVQHPDESLKAFSIRNCCKSTEAFSILETDAGHKDKLSSCFYLNLATNMNDSFSMIKKNEYAQDPEKWNISTIQTVNTYYGK